MIMGLIRWQWYNLPPPLALSNNMILLEFVEINIVMYRVTQDSCALFQYFTSVWFLHTHLISFVIPGLRIVNSHWYPSDVVGSQWNRPCLHICNKKVTAHDHQWKWQGPDTDLLEFTRSTCRASESSQKPNGPKNECNRIWRDRVNVCYRGGRWQNEYGKDLAKDDETKIYYLFIFW